MGKQKPLPEAQNVDGYPAAGLDDNYDGLCAFACNYGYCPAGVCVTGSKPPLSTPTVSPFTPDACTSGTGGGSFVGLCSYACNFGFCPIAICTCLTQGPLHVPPEANVTITGNPIGGINDHGLCTFACSRGYCPPDTCVQSSGSGGPGRDGSPVTIDPTVWQEPVPIASCIPPCVLVLPPYSLPTPTTISFPPITTTFTVKGRSTSTTVVTVSFPPVTTTRIPVFNLNITASSVDHIIYTITPSILPTAKIIVYDDTTPIPITVTSTPDGGTKTYPQVSSTPRGISFTSTTPPGPTCTSLTPGVCGDLCIDNCATCGFFGCGTICPGCGGGWSEGGGESQQGDCVGPSCPKDGEDYDDNGNDACQEDVVTTTGLCPNGNYPVFLPDTATVSCDFSAEQAPDVMTACQEEIDDNLSESVSAAGQSQSCCPAASRRRSVFDFFGLLSPRQAPCGPDPDYPNNPPPAGQDHHEVFLCDYDEWANVCANAQSAIVSRGKSPLMTYAGPNQRTGVMEEVTFPWYANKYHSGPKPKPNKKTGITELDGWALTGCEVEEYPWGSSAPNRSPNRKKWNDQSVLRLIPEEENKRHGKFLQTWLTQKGNGNIAQAKGLVFSVSFVGKRNLPTGTSDADFWIDPSKRSEAEAMNICAIPYGVEFLFVHAAVVDAGERRYDPWWDNKLIDKTMSLFTNAKGETTKTVESKTVSHYCKFPSPGKKIWNPANNKWEPRLPVTSWDRKRGNRYYSCDNYPGYSGPSMMRKRGRGRRSIADMTLDEIQELHKAGVNITISDGSIGVFDQVDGDLSDEDDFDEDQNDEADLLGISHQAFGPVLDPRANIKNSTALGERRMSAKRASSGSFLDASAFQYLGCGNANGDECALPGVQCEDNAADDSDTYDTTTSSGPPPATTSSSTSAPTPTSTPAPVPTGPSADCAFWDELLGWHFEVYNIANWSEDLGEDNGGQGLLDNERGCGALTGVSGNHCVTNCSMDFGKSIFPNTHIPFLCSWLT